nr:DUF397 domain-containing protein [Actinorhabdospora filicis]
MAWRKSSRSGSSSGNCVEVGGWRKSSRSGSSGGNCVEVGQLTDLTGVALRDTKDRKGPLLTFTVPQWRGLLADLKRGELDPR